MWTPNSSKNGRIFVSYRRDDSRWFVGRLVDSLSSYFGDERVFRDVADIPGGTDFHDLVEETLESADALIAVIGPNWLADADDESWVALEIGAALERGIPIYPVLVEDTPMPRAEDLPKSLQRLARYNAVSIGDDRWDDDVDRLAKIVGLDIPSVNERTLTFWNRIATVVLVSSVWIALASVLYRLVAKTNLETKNFFSTTWFEKDPNCAVAPFELASWEWGFIFVALLPCVVLTAVLTQSIARHRRAYLVAAACVGGAGSLLTLILFWRVCRTLDWSVAQLMGIGTVVTMLGLMNLSGFVPRS